jgi:hypothetical protein
MLTNSESRMKARFLWLVIGGLIGTFLGAGTGVVIGGGGGVPGIWVFGFLGALVGVLAAPDMVRLWARVSSMWR